MGSRPKKDADINEWRDKLDSMIGELLDPVLIWRRQRDALIDRNVDTKEILRLENAYVRSIINKNSLTYVSYVNGLAEQKDVRAIGQSLIASGIFSLIFGN